MSCGLPTAKFAIPGSPLRAQIGPLKNEMNGATVSRRLSMTPWRAGARHLAVAGGQPSLPESPASPSALPRPRLALGLGALGLLAFGDDGLLLDLDARRLDLGDDLVGIGEQRRIRRDLEIADVDRGVEVDEALDRVLDRLRQVVRQRPDPDRLQAVEQRAALVDDRDGRAGRDERDVDGELLGHPHEEEIDVERPPRHRVDLDAVDEHGLGLLAVDGQVDEGVGPAMAAELLEVVAVDADARRLQAATEHDRRQATVATQRGDLLADEFARLGGEGGTRGRGGGHGSCGTSDVGASRSRRRRGRAR